MRQATPADSTPLHCALPQRLNAPLRGSEGSIWISIGTSRRVIFLSAPLTLLLLLPRGYSLESAVRLEVTLVFQFTKMIMGAVKCVLVLQIGIDVRCRIFLFYGPEDYLGVKVTDTAQWHGVARGAVSSAVNVDLFRAKGCRTAISTDSQGCHMTPKRL